MLIDNLVGNNLILDFNEYKNTAPVANFTEANLANIPVIKSTNLEGVFCSGMGNLLTLKSSGNHSFSSFDWGFGGDSITLSGNSSTTDSKITGQVGGMDMYLEVKLLRDRSEGILHLVFPDAPYYITEHLYQSAQGVPQITMTHPPHQKLLLKIYSDHKLHLIRLKISQNLIPMQDISSQTISLVAPI